MPEDAREGRGGNVFVHVQQYAADYSTLKDFASNKYLPSGQGDGLTA
jgi:hypothetical protein